MKKIFLTTLCAALIVGCAKKENNVIAKVGSINITQDLVDQKLAQIGPEAEELKSNAAARKQLLDLLIKEKLILLAAEKSGIPASKTFKDQYSSKEKELNAILSDYKDYLLAKMWVQDLKNKDIKVTDEEVKSYYDANPYTVTLMQMFFTKDKMKEAEEVYKKVKKGESFEKLAAQYSLNPGTVTLPPIMKGEFLPQLEEAAFKMNVGESEGIIQTDIGLYIIKKVSQDKIEEKAAAGRIKNLLEKKKFDDYLDSLQKRTKVEIINENYK